MKSEAKRKTLRDKMLSKSKFYGKKVENDFGYKDDRMSKRKMTEEEKREREQWRKDEKAYLKKLKTIDYSRWR